MVGTQSVINVVSGNQYKIIPKEIKDYVKGLYGKSPVPISKEIKEKIIGDEELFEGRPADLIKNEYEEIKAEVGELAKNEEDILIYAMFPQVARTYLENRDKLAEKSKNRNEEIKIQNINVVF